MVCERSKLEVLFPTRSTTRTVVLESDAMKPQGTQPHRRQDLFGGQGEVLVWNLIGGRSLPPFSAVLACELEAGGSVGVHVQQAAHEIVIVTEGQGTAQVDGETQALMPGSVVWLPFGKRLALQSADTGPLRYLIVKVQAVPGID